MGGAAWKRHPRHESAAKQRSADGCEKPNQATPHPTREGKPKCCASASRVRANKLHTNTRAASRRTTLERTTALTRAPGIRNAAASQPMPARAVRSRTIVAKQCQIAARVVFQPQRANARTHTQKRSKEASREERAEERENEAREERRREHAKTEKKSERTRAHSIPHTEPIGLVQQLRVCVCFSLSSVLRRFLLSDSLLPLFSFPAIVDARAPPFLLLRLRAVAPSPPAQENIQKRTPL
jgi:hypothetical protein